MTAYESLTQAAEPLHALLRLAPGADPTAVWAALAGHPGVDARHPVKGTWDLLLRLSPTLGEDERQALSKDLKNQTGVSEVRLHPCRRLHGNGALPSASTAERPARLLCLLDAQQDAVGQLTAQLGELEEVLGVDLDQTGEQLLLDLGGRSFADLRALLSDRISLLPGVRRVEQVTLVQLVAPEGDGAAPQGGGPVEELPPLQRSLWRYEPNAGQLIPLLQQTQERYGYIPAHAIELISGVTGVGAADIYGIITFYAQFRLKPLGRHLIRQCQGTACHVNGAKELQEAIEDELGIPVGETDAEGQFTFTKVACLGCCSLAPVLMIDEETHGRLDPARIRKILKSYRKKAKTARD